MRVNMSILDYSWVVDMFQSTIYGHKSLFGPEMFLSVTLPYPATNPVMSECNNCYR